MTDRAAIRVAIVGAGLMGRWHAHAAARAGAHVVAVVDVDQDRAERVARRYRGCLALTTLSHALEAAEVVHICTPSDTHLSLAERSLRARRHVLIEKPIAPSATDAAYLLDLASTQEVLLCPVHQFPFQRGAEVALARVRDIGVLRHIDLAHHSAGAEGSDATTRDQIAVDILPHPLSLLVRLLDKPVDTLHWSVRRSGAGEFRAFTQTDDVTAAILVSMSGRPTVNQAQLVGTDGTIHLDLFHGFCFTENATVSRTRKVTRPYAYAGWLAAVATANLVRRVANREPAYPGLLTLVRRFYRATAGLEPSPISPADALTIARACDRLGILLLPPAGAGRGH